VEAFALKILILNQYCTPEPNFKSVPFAQELVRRGHEVRILTGFPNYPGGRLFQGYRIRPWQREIIGGIPILRVPLFPSHDHSAIRRTATYLSFAISVVPPLLGGWKPDLIYVWNLPLTALPAALAWAIRGVPYVMDIQDLWPDAVLNSGIAPSWVVGVGRLLTRYAYDQARALLVLSPGFKRILVERGIPAHRIDVVYNWCDEDSLRCDGRRPTSNLPPGFKGRFNIVYAGTMSRAQGLHAVIEAAALVARSHPKVQFVFMGSGRLQEELQASATRYASGNTLFLRQRSMDEAALVLRAADVLLVHLRKHPLYEITIPSKTQAYLAMGKPILIGTGQDAADLVRRAGAGLVCAPEDPHGIAEAAIRFANLGEKTLAEMGRRGHEFHEKEMSLRVGTSRMEAVFQKVVLHPSSASQSPAPASQPIPVNAPRH
jgi:colanic acid biosynthesis glycosyl transferase WcaI